MARKKKERSKSEDRRIVIVENGPYRVSGGLPLAKEIILTDSEGYSVKWGKGHRYPTREKYDLCRCGQSGKMPYCDDTHLEIGFDGTETASRKNYIERAKRIQGPDLVLTDAEDLCTNARFCDAAGGIWKLTRNSADAKSREMAIQEASNCPSGRLVVWDVKTGDPIEPKFEPSISLVEDPQQKASGPIWVKGGVPLESSSDGTRYETRNRVALCRCGSSANKPFCDGSHIQVEFVDD
jgi:CDGSH-type Zn-finger protein